MDLLAGELGLSPLELRRRNLLRDGDVFATGEVMHDVHFEECLQSAADAVGYEDDPRGKGLCVLLKGMQTPSRAQISVERTPLRCRGYIQSEKWKTSRPPASLSTGGWPARLQIVRQRFAEGGSATIRRSTSRSRRELSTSDRARMLITPRATISCRSSAASTSPCSEPRM